MVIYGFGLCWVCTVFEEIYGMMRKMTKREMGMKGREMIFLRRRRSVGESFFIIGF